MITQEQSRLRLIREPHKWRRAEGVLPRTVGSCERKGQEYEEGSLLLRGEAERRRRRRRDEE